MKKYQQLLLFVISVSSLSLLLVYRHEYNRLHYVLEVFNFFGSPCNFSELHSTDVLLTRHDWGVEPAWQESEDAYFYAGFWSEGQAKVIVLQTDGDAARNCHLWFEDKAKPVIGKFKYSKIAHDDKHSHSIIFYYCSLNLEHAPYAVSFSKGKKPNKKIYLTRTPSHKVFNTTVCVAPTEFSKTHLVEFVSYHKIVGIDNFVFYGNVPHRLNKILTNMSSRLGVTVAFFNWNYPKAESSLSRIVAENDCMLRVLPASKNVVTLEQDEYIVTQHYAFGDFISEHDSKTRISLPVQTFCVKDTSRRKPIVLQNTEVSYGDEKAVLYVYQNGADKGGDMINTQAVVKAEASVHKYINCLQKPVRVYQDNSILRYSTDLVRSTLVQLNLHDHL